MCHSRKYPHVPHQWSSEIPRGWGAVQRPKVLKECTKGGGEGVGGGGRGVRFKQKQNIHVVGIDIFWNH